MLAAAGGDGQIGGPEPRAPPPGSHRGRLRHARPPTPGPGQVMGNQVRKATKSEMARARRLIAETLPDLHAVFAGHGSHGGHRAPRDRTFSFRLRDRLGRLHANVVRLVPERLRDLTVDDLRGLVAESNGKRRWKGCRGGLLVTGRLGPGAPMPEEPGQTVRGNAREGPVEAEPPQSAGADDRLLPRRARRRLRSRLARRERFPGPGAGGGQTIARHAPGSRWTLPMGVTIP